jgi:hypothetical protein
MKKLSSIFAGLFFLALSYNAKAQTPPAKDYFVGNWSAVVTGTPQGDAKMLIALERKDGKLTGYQYSKEKTDTIRFAKVEEKEKSVTAYYTAGGYDINLTLEKKDDDHVTGNMMDMFDLTGERIKATASK